MIIHDVAQNTPEWAALRCGVPTASRFSDIVTASGAASESAERYMLHLLAERMMGTPIEENSSSWQERGKDLEIDAVRFYELQRDVETVPVGFITTDDGRIGASPDRLVGETGLLEAKSPSPWVHVGYLLQSGKAYSKYKVQCQGQLWVAVREWVDILSFAPEMPPSLHREERDEKFIEKLSAGVRAFSDKLEALADELIERGWIREWPLVARPRQAEGSTRAMTDALKDALRQAV